MATVLMPLPSRDFDPSEAAVSWRVLTDAGHTVRFATPDGRPGVADDLMVTGRGLDPWARVPGLGRLVLVGRALRADAAARRAYAEMTADPAYRAPATWSGSTLDGVDGLLLPGGHRARGMREFLESADLQSLVATAFARDLPVAAICHGVLLAARSADPATGRSVLHGRRTTALTWSLEGRAWRVARRTRFWEPDYYRTYPDGPGNPAGYMSVQQEVTRFLASPADFLDVPGTDPDARRKLAGRHRDTPSDARPAFVVRDGRYVSARWPGDAHTFAAVFAEVLTETATG
ncbi:type 1 glutamine amidotransferase domain-containing protein [Kitasatospora sp. NPDC049285]|uniref:type 1 glutamine amidotransferase domain-containing protein n=1 Tax=Kitasatospora sp. NPDC049285 TaxID=3157096 RepID=UPI00341C9417